MHQFIKHNSSNYQNSLIKEAQGLELLSTTLKLLQHSYIQVPKVHSVSNQQLVIDKINAVRPSLSQWREFGEALAELHKIRQNQYGLKEDNYIGLNPQKNTLTSNWGDFFFEYRLMAQVYLITNRLVKEEFANVLNAKKSKLVKFLNENCAYPSLVHGDLWSGNVLFNKSNVWLIDPAVYYGDREVDIAMTEMFGGFGSEFYQGYDSMYSRSEQYLNKKPIYNLYHCLNHFNLFGDGYKQPCYQYFEIVRNYFD